MDPTLTDLLDRMSAPEPDFRSSRDSVAFAAHREAEGLTDPALLDQLREHVLETPGPKGKRLRDAAYFVMGKLLTRVDDPDALAFLVGQVAVESDKYVLRSLLNLLGDLDLTEVDVGPVVAASTDSRWLVRHEAIRALGASQTDEAREAVRPFLDQEPSTKQTRYELGYTCMALARIGTADDLPRLETLATSRLKVVRETAQGAVDAIRRRTGGAR